MVGIGQYVRAILVDGIAAALPATEGFEAQLERNGVVTDIRRDSGTIRVEDIFGNEHLCHSESAVAMDVSALDEFIRIWVRKRARELGVIK